MQRRVVMMHRLFALASLAAACDDGRAPIRPCPSPLLVFDPFEHTVCLDHCVDALDCPRGSICSKEGDDNRGRCVIPTEVLQTSRSALLDGFAVSEMSAKLLKDNELALAWTRPEDAKLVHCVLLSCPPAFRVPYTQAEAGEDTQWLTPVEGDQVVIANYERCVLASATSTQPAGSFNLQEKDNLYTPGGLVAVEPEACKGYGCAPITELFAGCWAYDNTRLVAATRLFPIDISQQIFNYHEAFAPGKDCTSDENFRMCLVDPVNAKRPGVCVCKPTDPESLECTGSCMLPCLSDCDCREAAETMPCDHASGRQPTGYCDGGECVAFTGGDT